MISQTLDKMLSKMERSADENQSVAASCLRIDVNRWAEGHACYRCEKAVWMVEPMRPGIPKMGQPPKKKEFNWDLELGACGAFLPVTFHPESEKDHFPRGLYFCSGESKEVLAGGFASGAVERQGSGSGLAKREFPLRQVPRTRGE